jgi:hypothetical protein
VAAPAPHPTFLIIGAERAATRWLRFNLDRHPDICAPPLHLDFFSDPALMQSHGYRWYRRQFATFEGEPFVGEASPSYLMLRNRPAEVARRIQKAVPDVRLIAIVRNPIDRLHSAIRHDIRWGRLPPGESVYSLIASNSPAIQRCDPIGNSAILTSIVPYADRFGDQLQVLFYDDLVADPASFYQAALTHIGASPTFEPPDLDRVLFSDKDAVELEPLAGVELQIVYEWFRQDVELLADWIGRDLSSWIVDPYSGPGEFDFSFIFDPAER